MGSTNCIAEHFFLGPTEIVICDDKCVSKEEAEKLLEDLGKRVRPHLEEKARRKMREEQEKEGTA